MKNQQDGFSLIEGLLILVIVAILGFTGWYVWQSHNNANTSYNAASNSSQTATTGSINNKAKKASTATKTASCDLALTIANKQGAAGTIHEDLIFTNKGSSDCTLNGYPTVTLLDAGGKTIGSAASHDTSVTAAKITVKPNGAAYAGLSMPNQVTGTSCSSTKPANIQAVIPGLNLTLKTADTTDTYCSGFMTRPFSANPS